MLEKLKNAQKVVGTRRLLRAIEAGEIAEAYIGADADLCLFSLENIRENGTYTAPRRLAKGMDAVFVGGVPSLIGGEFTGEMCGAMLRRA